MIRALLVLTLCVSLANRANAQFSFKNLSSRPVQSIEDSLLFHPQTAAQRWFPVPPQIKVEDVWLRSADGQRIHAWWFPCENSTGALLFCHGNAGNLSQWAPRLLMLQRTLRKSVLILDYPGYGKSTGKPTEQGCYDSADAAYAWLTEQRRIAPTEIVLCGESLGGGVATELAVKRPHRGLVLIRTFTSVPDMARKSMWTSSAAPLLKNSFDNLERIPRCPAPIFIAHGDRDTLIPLLQGQTLYGAAREPKQFFLMRGLGHNEPYPDDLYPALAEFVRGAEPVAPAPNPFPVLIGK